MRMNPERNSPLGSAIFGSILLTIGVCVFALVLMGFSDLLQPVPMRTKGGGLVTSAGSFLMIAGILIACGVAILWQCWQNRSLKPKK